LFRFLFRKARALKYPSFGGENYKAKVNENRKVVNDGNTKVIFGTSLIGVSLILAGVGFSMSF
jgi:hypothetical protein